MGRYSGANDVQVTDRHPFINEQASTTVAVIESTRDGDSKSDGMPYAAAEVRVLHSDVYPEGQIRTWLQKQKAGKGQRNYYLADIKGFVGGALDYETKSEVSEEDLEKFFDPENPSCIGVVVQHRVYDKPPNAQGKVFKGSVTSFVAASEEEFNKMLADAG
jgi:hypothetical protein